MNCIAIDTTNENLCAVLIKDGASFYRNISVGKSGHSSLLMPTLDELFKQGCMGVEELDAVAAVVGPGSFTGIRIGVSAATALAFATKARRISVTSFELIAYGREKITAAVDAGHGNLYVAECDGGKVLKTWFSEDPDNFRSQSKRNDSVTQYDTEKHVSENSADYAFRPLMRSWEALEQTVRIKYANGDFVQVFEPFYLRKSQAEREKE